MHIIIKKYPKYCIKAKNPKIKFIRNLFYLSINTNKFNNKYNNEPIQHPTKIIGSNLKYFILKSK